VGNESDREPEIRGRFPKILPPWLILCLVVGTGFAFLGRLLALHPGDVYTYAAIGFGFGFCLMVIVLVSTHLFHREIEPSSGMLPPIWVTVPITVAAVVYFGANSVAEQRMSFSLGRSGGAIEIHGIGAVILGLLIVIVATGGVSGLMIWGKGMNTSIAAGIGICISLSGLVFSVVRIWQHLNE
jgi:hypothetical protein